MFLFVAQNSLERGRQACLSFWSPVHKCKYFFWFMFRCLVTQICPSPPRKTPTRVCVVLSGPQQEGDKDFLGDLRKALCLAGKGINYSLGYLLVPSSVQITLHGVSDLVHYSQKPLKAGITPMLQMGKLRLGEGKILAQGQTAS